jgi:dihydrofolate synthase/folylpolyglutamate synthase
MTAVFDRLLALEAFGIKLGLTNVTRLCEALGHPERAFASVHIAGTNGKGSVTAMVHEGLQSAGIHAARYTSPHLVHLAERFVIGAQQVDAGTLDDTTARVLDVADGLVRAGTLTGPPTFFEATTAIAFELFRQAGVQIAVIEVGLGGRFDATNVIHPLVTAITSIGWDHQLQLGDTLSAIAFEKAGIIKPGVPVVTGPLSGDAAATVSAVARERGAGLNRARDEIRISTHTDDGRTVADMDSPLHTYRHVPLGLRGRHQLDNALVALRVMELLRERGVDLSFEAIARGLGAVQWPGRLELMRLSEGRHLLIDAAHNIDGAAALARYLGEWHPERPALVFGVMHDKDVEGMLRQLLPAVGPVIATAPPIRRALAPAALVERIRTVDPHRGVLLESNPVRAVECALMQHSTVCVAGSIFLIGAVRDAFGPRAMLR